MGEFEIQEPSVANRPLRIALMGLGGSGKSLSSIYMGLGLAGGKGVVLVDTENGKAGYYSDIPGWRMISIEDDFNPERILAAVETAVKSGAACVILDSLSAAWQGIGGCIDIANSQTNKYGKELQGLQKWDKPKALHRDLLNYLLFAPCHIIFTLRVKRNFRQFKDPETQKEVIVQDGFEPISEWNSTYETDINLDLDMQHRATATKDVTRQLPHQPFIISEAHGKLLADWLAARGVVVEAPPGAAYSDSYIAQALDMLGVPRRKHAETIKAQLGNSDPDDAGVIDKLRARLDAKVNERNKE